MENKKVHIDFFRNANIINKNEPFMFHTIDDDVVIDNGKLKMYSYSNGDDVYLKDSEGMLLRHPLELVQQKSVFDFYPDLDEYEISYLREHNFSELLIKDFINKNNNIMVLDDYNNVDKSIFRPIEKLQPTLNDSTLLTSNFGNAVLKVKQKVKLTASKIRSFLGFLNGGQLKYYKNGK